MDLPGVRINVVHAPAEVHYLWNKLDELIEYSGLNTCNEQIMKML
jgi:hypothetical protein